MGCDEGSQLALFGPTEDAPRLHVAPFGLQLLKWIGNKQRFAHRIISYFPPDLRTYYEPFLGSGAVLGTLVPSRAVASDALAPLMEIWSGVRDDPEGVVAAYASRLREYSEDADTAYCRIRERYGQSPNGHDLLFLSRACYGGVVRFRRDGYMSTPVGAHSPVSVKSLAHRVDVWRRRVMGAEFVCCDFEEAIDRAGWRDVVYCDPPYGDTQSILYGAQSFDLNRLLRTIDSARSRGALVALSIDGTKKSGRRTCPVALPDGLFRRTVHLDGGRSMLRRFQMVGQTLEAEAVADRLALTW